MKRLTITRIFNCGEVRILEERHPRGTNLIKQIIKGKYHVQELEDFYRNKFAKEENHIKQLLDKIYPNLEQDLEDNFQEGDYGDFEGDIAFIGEITLKALGYIIDKDDHDDE